ncbi:MAG: hypothetical protein FJX44_04805 [Alphaproteobacteria bacterium]|nr:hypothetical protein [Alphaproteobacteria bacterium]
MAYWLGWSVYAASLLLAIAYIVLFILVCIVVAGIDPFATMGSVASLLVPALVVSGLGRDVLFLLAGK